MFDFDNKLILDNVTHRWSDVFVVASFIARNSEKFKEEKPSPRVTTIITIGEYLLPGIVGICFSNKNEIHIPFTIL